MKQYSERAQQIFNRDDVTVIGFDNHHGHYFQIGEGFGAPRVAISRQVYWELVEMGEDSLEEESHVSEVAEMNGPEAEQELEDSWETWEEMFEQYEANPNKVHYTSPQHQTESNESELDQDHEDEQFEAWYADRYNDTHDTDWGMDWDQHTPSYY
jgi:hypothetical protein